MGLSSGPNNANLGLVFTYDTGDTVNSYIGEPLVNCATDLSNGSNVTVTEITDGSITPPFPGMRVYKFVTANSSNLYRQGGYYNGGGFGGSNPQPLILGTTTPSNFTTVGTGKYRFGMYVRGETTNQVGDGVTIDIGDRNQVGTTVGTNINWQLLQTNDALGIADSNYPYDFFDISAAFNMTFYVAGYGIWRSPGTVTSLPFIQAYPIGNQYLPYGQSRSFTQGLLSLTGSTIDLSNVSFNSSAQIVFDGTNDYINTNFTSGYQGTVELIIKCSSYNGTIPFSLDSDNFSSGPNIYFSGGLINWNTGDSQDNAFTNSSYPNSNYHHLVITNQFSGAALYIDGVLIGTAAGRNMTTTGNNKLWLGRFHGDGYYFNGDLPVVRLYNTPLNTSEVQENYQNYKTRFNLT
jgi:hypothetical protein